MQCQCRADLENKLRQHIEEKLPEGAQDYEARLQGYGFGMNPDTLTPTSIMMIPYKGEVMVPKKSGGGMKRQKIDTSVRASFCPFCGTPTSSEKDT